MAVGRDDPFEFAPELVYRVEFGCLLRQPAEPDAQPVGEGLHLPIGVRTSVIGEEPDRVGPSVTATHLDQEYPRVCSASPPRVP